MSNSINVSPGAATAPAVGAYSAVERHAPARGAAVAEAPASRTGDPAPVAVPARPPSREQLQAAVSTANRRASELQGTNLQFAIDDEYGAMVVKVTDAETKEVIRQIPPEAMLKLAKFFADLAEAQRETDTAATGTERGGYGASGERAVIEGLLIRVQA
ncbi:flagellar protein FlaG [Plasticicumulans lactativorans]|uniref:Flagellar protein FlaG n=1 Tax=Plasticicumulans lactativorans TaxID=1133106 RepID=A0A4R2L5I0_9GAMM|nr:flagellar protein FlaG [Plasticicumulans lactativorans]TCO81072.1 flagellar protein FlaG [Plasticicumulans lactativorans]